MENWKLETIGYWVIRAGSYREQGVELSPSPPTCQKDSKKILPMLISVSWSSLMAYWVVVQKIYSKMLPVSCINSHHDITDLYNH